jgi:hypothetical protein
MAEFRFCMAHAPCIPRNLSIFAGRWPGAMQCVEAQFLAKKGRTDALNRYRVYYQTVAVQNLNNMHTIADNSMHVHSSKKVSNEQSNSCVAGFSVVFHSRYSFPVYGIREHPQRWQAEQEVKQAAPSFELRRNCVRFTWKPAWDRGKDTGYQVAFVEQALRTRVCSAPSPKNPNDAAVRLGPYLMFRVASVLLRLPEYLVLRIRMWSKRCPHNKQRHELACSCEDICRG